MNKLDSRFIVTPNQFKNRIINGDFQIWQRGTSFSFESSSSDNTATIGYTADRIESFNVSAGGRFTVTKGNLGGFNSFKVTVDTPPDNLSSDGGVTRYWVPFIYTFEGQHLYDLASNKKVVTISFLFKSNVSGNFSVSLRNLSYYGQTGSWDTTKNDYYVTYFTYDGSETPKKVIITIPLNYNWTYGIFNDEKAGFDLTIAPIGDYAKTSTINTWFTGSTHDTYIYENYTNWASQAGNYIEITQLQLEEGSEATDFEYVPYDIQLLRCMRYYEKIKCENSIAVSGEVNNQWQTQVFSFKVKKRTIPSVSLLTVTFDTSNSKFTFDIIEATTDGVSFLTNSGPDSSSKPVDIIEGPIIIEADAEL